MKKEARTKAEALFLQSGGKVSTTELAKKLGVHPLTVGRWKRQDNWTAKLEKPKPVTPERKPATVVRKKSKQEEALKLYTNSGGRISNKALATKVGVSAATISNWKKAGSWSSRPDMPSLSVPAAIKGVEEELLLATGQDEQALEEIEIDLEALTSPDHITVLNKRMDEILARGYLSPLDLKIAAEAKEALLRVVGAYMDVLEKASED